VFLAAKNNQLLDRLSYGTTTIVGTFGFGVVFKLDKSGKETAPHTFTERLWDGENPFGGLIWGQAGILYGYTYRRGFWHRIGDGV
jgi:uncharacterized repeat protein (TIGR03803 family)